MTGLVAFGHGFASVGADLCLCLWSTDGTLLRDVGLPTPASALAIEGTVLFLAAPDGSLRVVSAGGADIRQIELTTRPLLSMAAAPGRVVVGATMGKM